MEQGKLENQTAKICFNNSRYLEIQRKEIVKRIQMFDNKLYLEFGGKILDDYHASRVLPGFDMGIKIKLLQSLRDDLEVIICIKADDIERHRIRADFGITYDMEVLRLIDKMREMHIDVNSVVITQFDGQPDAASFAEKLRRRDIVTYTHSYTKGYPTDVDIIVSDEGYGANDYIKTTKPLVVVTAPGAGGGKLGTCLSQLYHEYKRGVKAGYAKYETFPIWNLPLKHPVNIAYEASTADINDVNMIDPFHLEAYGKTAVNYNRDIAVFPVLQNILRKIAMEDVYKSPTDMGVNMAGYCIEDDELSKLHARREIIRRYYKSLCDYKEGISDKDVSQRIILLMRELSITEEERPVIAAATEKSNREHASVVALELSDGRIITGKDNGLMTAAASTVINAIKTLANIDDSIHLLSPAVLEPMIGMKANVFGGGANLLSLYDVLLGLRICAVTNPTIEAALAKLPELNGCDAHASHIIPQSDEGTLKELKVSLTCQPSFYTDNLYKNS